MRLPEEVRSLRSKELVVHVVAVGHAEWWVLRKHDKEDNTDGEEVDNLTLVWVLVENFRGHVSGCSDDRPVEAASITSFERACESEINDLNVVILVQ